MMIETPALDRGLLHLVQWTKKWAHTTTTTTTPI